MFSKPSGNLTVVQVNLCQKLLFLHQLTHNMTTDCSLNHQNQAQNMLCTQIIFCFCFDIQNNLCTQHVLNVFSTCSELAIFMYWTRNSMMQEYVLLKNIYLYLINEQKAGRNISYPKVSLFFHVCLCFGSQFWISETF